LVYFSRFGTLYQEISGNPSVPRSTLVGKQTRDRVSLIPVKK
jgi:hypothetical protein